MVLTLVGMAHGIRHGHELIVALNLVIVAIAIWELAYLRRHVTTPTPSPATVRSTDSPSGNHPGLSSTDISSPGRPQAFPSVAAPDQVTAGNRQKLPSVDSFAITGRLRETATAVTGSLSLILPADTEVPAASAVAALLTVGHRILEEHGLTHQPLPQVDATAVNQAERPPTAAPGTGFTVHITNDLTTCCSHITIAADPRLGAEGGTLLIAAALLAGAELLLECPDRPLQHRTAPTRR